jgi:hypothetical protein
MSSGAIRPYVPEISRETIIDLVADMNRVGFGVLSGYLESADLEDLRQLVETAVAAAAGEYVVFTGAEAVAGTLLDKLSASPAFVNLLHRVYEQGSGRAAPNQSLYQVLRCLKGKSGLKHALYFHYDSYVVTALLPVIIPSQGNAGHLVMAPNWRPVRSSYLFNLLDKIILDNPATQFLLRRALRSGLLKLKQIPMVPGNLYFFWGIGLCMPTRHAIRTKSGQRRCFTLAIPMPIVVCAGSPVALRVGLESAYANRLKF